jgi:outer membrane protein OmpA-like peptidoglycan-associated protein
MKRPAVCIRCQAVSLKLGLVVAALPLAIAAGCASQHVPLPALMQAREDFGRAKSGLAMQFDPTDVHVADLALRKAEQAFRDQPDDPTTTDLAVIADRRALIAESEAAAIHFQREAAAANERTAALTAERLQKAQGQLGQTQQALGRTQMQLQDEQASSGAQAQRMQDLQLKLKDARNTIARIAAVKDDERGMVITLQGEVLFKTGRSELKAGAMAKLDQIANALRGKEQPIVVYGYTDDVGAIDMNMDLSRRRALAVRDYLVSKGISQYLITSEGKGPADPISDNSSVEGRSSNRRVEIVVEPQGK